MGFLSKLFGPPSKDEYARSVLEGARKAGETREVKYESEEFRFIIRNAKAKDDAVFNLSNMYAEYCSVPKANRPACIQKAVQTWVSIATNQLPSEFEDAKPDLLPVVRERSTLELHNLRQQLEGGAQLNWVHEVLGEHYVLGLVFDLPTTMRFLSADDLEEWGITFYEAMEVARTNLEQLEFGGYGKIGDGVYSFLPVDDYISTRMVLLDLIRSLEVTGDPVALIPQRRELLVAGSEDEQALAVIATLATEAMKQPRASSPQPLRLEGEHWVPWVPEPAHAAYEPLKMMQVQLLGRIYQEQQELLATLTRQQNDDVFVSTFSAMKSKDSEENPSIKSYAVWPESLCCLLPRADYISFVRAAAEGGPGDVVGMAPWEKVISIMGEAMVDEEMYPARYRVSVFPTDEQLKQIIVQN